MLSNDCHVYGRYLLTWAFCHDFFADGPLAAHMRVLMHENPLRPLMVLFFLVRIMLHSYREMESYSARAVQPIKVAADHQDHWSAVCQMPVWKPDMSFATGHFT